MHLTMIKKEHTQLRKQLKKIGGGRFIFRKVLHLLARNVIGDIFRVWLFKLMGVHIGKNVYIGVDCFIDDIYSELITIEDEVIISFRATIVAHDQAYNPERIGKVLIRKNSFIGAGSIILPGVTIGEGAIVGAGAVVTKDVAPGTVVGGVPARPLNKTGKEAGSREISLEADRCTRVK